MKRLLIEVAAFALASGILALVMTGSLGTAGVAMLLAPVAVVIWRGKLKGARDAGPFERDKRPDGS